MYNKLNFYIYFVFKINIIIMKKIIYLLILFSSFSNLKAQSVQEGKYENIQMFNGFSRVTENGKYGLLNQKMELIIPIEYDYISTFFDGLVIVKKDCQWEGDICEGGKAGIIDYTGKIILDPKYHIIELTEIERNEQPIIIFQDPTSKKYGFLNRMNLTIISPIYDEAPYLIGVNKINVILDKTALEVDLNGKKLPQAKTKEKEKEFDMIFEENGLFGLKAKNGQVILKPTYHHISPFTDGLALVRVGEMSQYRTLASSSGEDSLMIDPITGVVTVVYETIRGKFGYIDKTGKEIIPPIYKHAFPFSEGVALVNNTDSFDYQLIDKKGKETGVKITQQCLECSGQFSEGLLAVERWEKNSERKFGFVDKNGKEVLSFVYSSASDFKNGLAIISISDYAGLIDKTGKFIIPAIYRGISKTNENIFACELSTNDLSVNQYLYFDSKGNKIESYSPLSERDKSDIIWKNHMVGGNSCSFIPSKNDGFIYTHGNIGETRYVTLMNPRGEDSIVTQIDPYTGEQIEVVVYKEIRDVKFAQFILNQKGEFLFLSSKELLNRPLYQLNDGSFYSGGFGELLKKNTLGEIQWKADIFANEISQNQRFAFNLDGSVIYTQFDYLDDTTTFEGNISIDRTRMLWIKKSDQNGNELFNKELDGKFEAQQINTTVDGGSIMTTWLNKATKERSVYNLYDDEGNELNSINMVESTYDRSSISILKLDKKGDIEWEKSYNPTAFECNSNDIQQTTDGGYLMAGWNANVEPVPSATSFLVKFDKNGTLEWEKSYGQEIYRAIQTPDQTYAVLAISNAQTGELTEAGEPRFCFLKLDKNGNILWKKSLGTQSDSSKVGLYLAKDGNFIITGTDSKGFFVMKLKNK
jgi:hypothetical protein